MKMPKRKKWNRQGSTLCILSLETLIMSALLFCFLFYVLSLFLLVSSRRHPNEEKHSKLYLDWHELAVGLAKLPPNDILRILEEKDPFGTRTFAKQLKNAEERKGSRLDDLRDIQQLWSCPRDRISLPDQRDHSKSKAFKQGSGFLFFQHLRKAGGTNFCTLAKANLPEENVPPYYCMPDYHWPQDKKQDGHNCAGCLHQYSNEQIISNIKNHRIAANEWEPFDPNRHFELPAVFATSFRRPMDRALSQYRFECVEERGCKIHDVGEWWKRRRDLFNVYTRTFSDMNRMGLIATATSAEAAEKRGEAVGRALDTIAKFHLVLSMEWLRYASDQVHDVLGFEDTSALTTPVRPHNAEKQRNNSWLPEDYLTAEQYQSFRENLALDEILTDAAQRFFLERLVCGS